MGQSEYISCKEIAKKLNISEGDVLLLTSDILKLAMKARKAEKSFSSDAFIDSFLEALGAEGTLLIPAYNFDLEDGDAYSISETGPMTGSLAVAAMKRTDFIRTSNPLHSFLVCGKDANLLAEMNNSSSFGSDSPFAYLMEKNAIMIFAGTSISEAMTFTHFVEESLQVRYRKNKKINILYTDHKGKKEHRNYTLFRKKCGWTMRLHLLEQVFPESAFKKITINGVSFTMIRCEEAFKTIRKDIEENNAVNIAGFSTGLYTQGLLRFNIFRTTYGKIRSAKRLH